MADGQVGGNESVHWVVNADKPSAVKHGPNGQKWRQSGVDYHGKNGLGDDFVIRIKLPEGAAKKPWLAALAATITDALQAPNTPERLEFKLPILRGIEARTQVQVAWGDIPPWGEGLQAVHPTKEDKAVPAYRAGV